VSSFVANEGPVDRAAPPRALVLGVAGVSLTDAEKQFFRYANPLGFILFQRNCTAPQQVKELVAGLRECLGREAPIFIDQEGGRVARLKPPQWPAFPPARMFGLLSETRPELGLEAAKVNAQLIALELMELGITVNCAPLADMLFDKTDNAIGDRAFSTRPDVVAECARAYAEGLMWAGVLPVIKHLPGHGRTLVDPHHVQSTVTASRDELAATDFLPFKALKDMPLGMTCHVVFSALDNRPASISPVIHDIIRNEIGFDGLLISDDLNMKGIVGRLEDLGQAVLRAGSDIALHCNGSMAEMMQMASVIPPMTDAALARWEKAQTRLSRPPVFADKEGLTDRLDMLLGVAAVKA
jgi:beta-N-acetylhexosaminidase